MSPERFHRLVAKASLAPSVHNVQPAKWRLEGDRVTLFEDVRMRLPAGDPEGHDAAISLGAAFEGFCLAASEEDTRVVSIGENGAGDQGHLRPVRELELQKGSTADPLAKAVASRQSWRGAFTAPTEEDRQAARTLAAEDCHPVTDPERVREIAGLCDTASFGYMKDKAFRTELLSWMRLSKRHARWSVDGLNAEAMGLGRVERIGAGIVMGRAFGFFNAVGLAAPLLAEAGKTAGAAAILIFSRPADEDPFESGRAFYRAWLHIEAQGFAAQVLAALADDPAAAAQVHTMAALPANHRVVSAFRIGRPTAQKPYPRARRSVEELIV